LELFLVDVVAQSELTISQPDSPVLDERGEPKPRLMAASTLQSITRSVIHLVRTQPYPPVITKSLIHIAVLAYTCGNCNRDRGYGRRSQVGELRSVSLADEKVCYRIIAAKDLSRPHLPKDVFGPDRVVIMLEYLMAGEFITPVVSLRMNLADLRQYRTVPHWSYCS
jgi:hypothetical protein